MAGSKPKIKQYDPSKYEAKIQVMKQDLKRGIDEKAMQTQQGAIDASREGIEDLYKGIGLLSEYMTKRSDQQKAVGKIYEQGSGGLLSMSQGLKGQAAQIVDNFIGNYKV